MGAPQVVLVVKNPPANAGNTRDAGSIPKSGRHPLEEGMATHSSILAWRIPWIEEAGGLTVHRVAKSQTWLKWLSSVQFTHSVVSDSLRPNGLHTPGLPVYQHLQSLLKLMSIESVMPPNHHILCRPFASCLQSFPASGSFQMGQLSALGGHCIGGAGINRWSSDDP